MYNVVSSLPATTRPVISEEDVLSYFRADSSDDDRLKKELKNAVDYATAYIEENTFYGLHQKVYRLEYTNAKKNEFLPFGPVQIQAITGEEGLGDVEGYLSEGSFPAFVDDFDSVQVSYVGGYETLGMDWQLLILDTAAYLLDNRGAPVSESLFNRIMRKSRVLWY